MGSKRYYRLCAILPITLLIISFLLPLAFTLLNAFFVDYTFSFEMLKETFTSTFNYKILRFTSLQALISALVSLLIALPGAIIFSNYQFKLKKLILSLSSICFILPAILVVLGFVIFYGNNGVLNNLLKMIFKSDTHVVKILYSYKAIILAHSFLNFPIALTLIYTFYSKLSDSEEKAALMLGSSQINIFFTITLRKLMPTIISAMLLIFLYCFSSFSIILVLGGGPQYTTLEVEIYRLNNMLGQSDKASSLAIFALCFNSIPVIVYSILHKSIKNKSDKVSRDVKKIKSILLKIFLFIYILLLLLFILGPIASIVYRSFISTSNRYESGFTLNAYKELFGIIKSFTNLRNAKSAIINSLIIALSSSILSTYLSLHISLYIARLRSALVEVLTMLPMMVSSITVALGYFLIKSRLEYDSILISYLMIFIAHFTINLPFATRTILDHAKTFDENILYSAYTLGASEAKASRSVEKPILLRAIVRAFCFSFALSLGEMNATMTLSDGKISTLPVLLYRLIGSYNYQGSCALGTILILLTLLFFMLGEFCFGGNGGKA